MILSGIVKYRIIALFIEIILYPVEACGLHTYYFIMFVTKTMCVLHAMEYMREVAQQNVLNDVAICFGL